MNERITEIARTAGVKVSEIDAGYGITTKTVLYDEDIEEFAEKIIQECIEICDKVQIKYGQYTFTARICKEEIKTHFGVE